MKKRNSQYIKQFGINSIYIKMYMTFVSIFLIVMLIAWGFVYFYNTNIIRDKVNESSMQALQLIQNDIDVSIEKAKSMATNISLRSEVAEDYQSLGIDEKYYLTFDFIDQYEYQDYVESVGIYYYPSQTVLTFDESATSVKYSSDTEWIAQFAEPDALGVETVEFCRTAAGSENAHIITLLQGYPMLAVEKTGFVFVNLNRDLLFRNIADHSSSDRHILVTDKDRNLVFGDPSLWEAAAGNEAPESGTFQSMETGGEKYEVSYLHSADTAWNYYYIVNEHYLLKESKRISKLYIVLLILLGGLGFFAWRPFANKIYGSITNVLDTFQREELDFGESEAGRNELDLVNRFVEQMVLQNNAAASIFRQNQSDFEKTIFFKLMNESDGSLEQIQKELQMVGFEYETGIFLAMNVRLEDNAVHGESVEAADIIEDFMRAHDMEKRYISTELDTGSCVLLLNVKNCREEKYEFAVSLMHTLRQKTGCAVTIGMGRMYDKLSLAGKSVVEAMMALRFKTFVGKGAVIDIECLPEGQHDQQNYFDISKLVQFIGAIKSGSRGISREIINSIFNNIEPSIETVDYVSGMMWQMINGMMIALHEMNLKFEEVFGVTEFECYKRFTQLDEIQTMKQYIENLVDGIFQYIKDKDSNVNEELVFTMKEYIDSHFAEEIMLNDLADRLHLSVSYASSLFKQYVGENFVDYLRNVRMEKAKWMLVNTKASVNEIALKTGYTNARSFLRTFKNYTSMTPTEYRKIHTVRLRRTEDE